MYSSPDHETALDLCARAGAALGFKPSTLEHGREVLWYEVRAHGWQDGPGNVANAWGVYPRWRYADKWDGRSSTLQNEMALGVGNAGPFGGPFVPLAEVPAWATIEAERRDIFRADSLLEDFVSTALQDLQLSESDEACGEEREARDSGTIYTLDARTFDSMRRTVEAFRADCGPHIDAALDLEPGTTGREYGMGELTDERIGSTLWLAVTGTGVTFTDDGDAPCLVAMADWARSHHVEGLYFGDNGGVYLS